jgi:hypothetical protein
MSVSLLIDYKVIANNEYNYFFFKILFQTKYNSLSGNLYICCMYNKGLYE